MRLVSPNDKISDDEAETILGFLSELQEFKPTLQEVLMIEPFLNLICNTGIEISRTDYDLINTLREKNEFDPEIDKGLHTLQARIANA
jgi:hypothetical protein